MRKHLSVLPFLLFSFYSFSQSVNASLSKAKNHMERGEYYEAAAYYLDALKQDSLNKKANLEYGLLNTQYINNPGAAGIYLQRAERLSTTDTMPELLLGLAQYYQHVSLYKKALDYYKRMFSKLERKPESQEIETIILRSMANCEYALSNPVQPVFKRLKTVNAGEGVNSIYPEYSPVVSNETVLMFTTRRKNNTGHRIDDADGNYFEDMYIARKTTGIDFTNAHPFSSEDQEVKGIVNTKGHEAVVALSFDGTHFFTYRNNKLYQSKWQNNSWTAPELMSAVINPAKGFQSHLSISLDNKTIYFSSDRQGGFGGLDIYKTELKPDGSWGEAENLGPVINTKEDDDSPFIGYDGKTFYFSSKGHPGYGGYDLFKSSLNGGQWEGPVNLGTLFNSSGDDTHLEFNKDESSGIFASAKAGGFGDMDIYEIRLEAPFENFTVDALNRISINLPDTFYLNEVASFGVFSDKLPPSAFKNYYWQVGDSILKTNGETATYTFSKAGIYPVRIQGLTKDNDLLGYEKKVVITSRPIISVATHSATATTHSSVATNTASTSNNTPVSSLESIYFRFGKSGITAEAGETLMRNLKILKDDPNATISISAYCDSRGSADYNQQLSNLRAHAAERFLISHGLPKSRIKQITGFGEKDPLNKCADGTPCTAGEYKVNRRVQFQVFKP